MVHKIKIVAKTQELTNDNVLEKLLLRLHSWTDLKYSSVPRDFAKSKKKI